MPDYRKGIVVMPKKFDIPVFSDREMEAFRLHFGTSVEFMSDEYWERIRAMTPDQRQELWLGKFAEKEDKP